MKFRNFLAVSALTVSCGAMVFAGCGGGNETKTVEGDYHYVTDYGTYGVKVSVEVEDSSVGYKIKKVSLIDCDYTVTTSAQYGFADEAKWNGGLNALLDVYSGRTVSSVLEKKVTTDASSAPTAVSDSAFVIAGVTQSSGRLLLAVQNALKKL